ncbi:unnamed protein product [Gongylonema pulchrum]|uniref:ANK_REP_REGION domain-containing protein n=1 Tax=Gongylonema pulchrum TaxID=637853 RepID=A0A183DPY8_9BILA|nr:unnamed protein product [Gongylonema pulchrum]
MLRSARDRNSPELPRLRNGILASALAELEAQRNVPVGQRPSILTEAANQALNPELVLRFLVELRLFLGFFFIQMLRSARDRNSPELPRLRNGILASALAELEAQRNGPIGQRPSILTEAANQALNPEYNHRGRKRLRDSLPPQYHGIIASALQNESEMNGYTLPPVDVSQGFRSDGGSDGRTPKGSSANSSIAAKDSLDRALSADGYDTAAPRHTKRRRSRSGMLGKWLQELAESAPDLRSKKNTKRQSSLEDKLDERNSRRFAEARGSLMSPRTGMLGVLLSEKANIPEKSVPSKPSTASNRPVSSQSRVSDVYPFIAEETTSSIKSRSPIDRITDERAKRFSTTSFPREHGESGGMLQQALEHLSDTVINPALIFRDSASLGESVTKRGGLRSRDSGDRISIRSVTSKGSGTRSAELSEEENEFDANPSSKLLHCAMKGEWATVEQILRDEKDLDLTLSDSDGRTVAHIAAAFANEEMLRRLLDRKIDVKQCGGRGFTVLLYAVKDSKIGIFASLLSRKAEINAKTKDGRIVAHIAAAFANEEMVRRLLDRKIDVKQCGGTPLHYACSRASQRGSRVVDLLLEQWNDGRYAEDAQKCLPIHYAIQCGNITTAKLLLTDGEQQQITHVNANGDTLMHVACRSDNTDMLQLLVNFGGIDVNAVNEVGWTALHEASSKGNVAALKILHRLKANPNIADKEDWTPLHVAAAAGHTNVVELLIDKFGGSIRARTRDGSTLLHVAALSGHAETALVFLKRGVPLHMPNKRGALSLHCAAAAGFNDVVRMLISKGTHVDIRTRVNANGDTLMHVACRSDNTDMLQLLVNFDGTDVDAVNAVGWTPLHEASSKGNIAALKILHRLKANPNIADKFSTNIPGALSLHCAAAAGFNDVVRMLISKGTNVDIRTRDNYTALHVAVQAGKASVVETLLGYGANVDIHGGAIGETALHIAASLTTEDAIDCAMMLLKSGAQPNAARNDGETALHIAASNPLPGMIQLLLSEGADPQITSARSESALHVAARSCNSEAVSLILEHLAKQLSPHEINEFVNARTAQLHFPGEEAKLINTLIDYGGSPNIQTITNQETAMHLAARAGNETALLAIVAKIGAGAVQIVQNKQSKAGWSPLMEACALGHLGVARILLQHHARVDVFDENGRTALHLAAANGHLELTDLLLKNKAFDHGAAVEAITLDNQTALHFAARYGQLEVAQRLLALGANPNARDDKGQTPLHLAAENDYPDVVKLFLKMRQNNRAVLTAIDLNGFTCAHIAAMKGSLAVVKELMMIDKAMVIQHGMTALHLGAKNGFVSILNVFDHSLWRKCSKKTGLNALHIAAYYGNSDFVMEMLKHVPASSRSEPPIYNHYVVKEFATEYGFTPLHLAAQSGHDALVRMLLNQGVQVDATSTTMNGWTGMHYATKAGHLNVVKLFVKSSADAQAETKEGKVPLCFAAAHNHIDCLRFLLKQKHDTHALMEDRKFIFDLMVCGKTNDNEPLREFILQSPAPMDTAVKLSALYREMSEKEKERARDLLNVSEFAENMAVELLGITATEYNAALLLKAKDNRGRPLLDVLIENEQVWNFVEQLKI